MSGTLEDWETQQEAKRAAAHIGGPLSFLAGGGAAARRDQEERRVSDELAREAQERRKKEVEATMKALREALFPDEVAYYRDMLLGFELMPEEQEELRRLLWEKMG